MYIYIHTHICICILYIHIYSIYKSYILPPNYHSKTGQCVLGPRDAPARGSPVLRRSPALSHRGWRLE